MSWTSKANHTQHEPAVPEKSLEELVFQALGEASMCWSETPKGVFDGERAKRIGDELIQAIEVRMHVRAGVMTINEARQEMGLPPVSL